MDIQLQATLLLVLIKSREQAVEKPQPAGRAPMLAILSFAPQPDT
jgi:hypothetical protein